ncbi:MAG TPA: hypothetical protein VES40_14640 [Ilumatobacteraceae bacterium]|nr:hypothetical protein [Ilumatobacteraceae bacterium]
MNKISVITSDVSDQFFAPVDARRVSTVGRASIIGVVGIIIMYLAIGSLFALEQPPFIGADEKAHLGYAHVVADGSLPTIDQLQPVPIWARQWMGEWVSTTPFANRTIWVANHPPLYYVSVAPLIWFSELTQRPDGGLLLMRLANIAWGAIGLAFTYAIASEVTKSRRIALVSTGVAAMVTQLYASLSLGMSDGMAFAAGAAVTWAGLRCLNRGTTSRNLLLLALTTAVATGTRAATMLVAFSVVATVAAFEYAKPVPTNSDRRRSALRVGFIGILPAALLFGWFYLRNIVLYGDIGASSYLLERFDREPSGSIVSTLLRDGMWRSLYGRSMSPLTYGGGRPTGMLVIAAIAVVGLVAAVIARRTGDRDQSGERYGIARRSILLLVIGVGVTVYYIAEHVSGGGYLHPRYVFPVLGSVATLFVIGFDRIAPRILPVAVLIGMATWTLVQLPVGVDPSLSSRPRDEGRLAPIALRTLPGSDWWRSFTALWIVVGCVIAAAAIAAVVFGRGPLADVELTPDSSSRSGT